MRFGQKVSVISTVSCAAIAGALITSPALAAERNVGAKTHAKPLVPKGKAGIQARFAKELGRELNQARRARKLAPLRGSKVLKRAARRHSMFMAQTSRLQHTGRGGSLFWQRFVRLGYSRNARMSEIIAKRNVCKPGDPTLIVKKWIASPPHRVLMFDRKIRYFGAGVASKSRCSLTFYTMAFGS